MVIKQMTMSSYEDLAFQLQDSWVRASARAVRRKRCRGEAPSRSSIHRILTNVDVQPHRFQLWLHSPDSLFREKVAEICALYLQPPPGSIVVSFDEKTGVQAIERKHPDRRSRPGRRVRQEFEYIRHGTQSLLATMNVHTGEVLANCGPMRTGDDMERHMDRVAARWPNVEIHVVLDNLNIHKGERWQRFNERHGQRRSRRGHGKSAATTPAARSPGSVERIGSPATSRRRARRGCRALRTFRRLPK
jgi:hypothetical protein